MPKKAKPVLDNGLLAVEVITRGVIQVSILRDPDLGDVIPDSASMNRMRMALKATERVQGTYPDRKRDGDKIVLVRAETFVEDDEVAKAMAEQALQGVTLIAIAGGLPKHLQKKEDAGTTKAAKRPQRPRLALAGSRR